MRRRANQKQWQHLLDLLGYLMNACGAIGYIVGVIGSLILLYQLGYSVWVLLLFVPVILIGSVGFGIPLGLVAGLPLMLLLLGFIHWFHPETSPAHEKE